LLALMAVAGAGRYLMAQPIIDADHVAYYNDGDPVTLIGRIIDEPDIRDNYINLRVQAQSITLSESAARPVMGLILVRGPRYPEYHYGDTLSIFASLETPPIFDTFSYQDYLARQNIYSLVRRPRISLVAKQQGFSLKATLFSLKMRAHEAVNRILPEPHAALLNGVLLGIESGIPKSLYEQFNATGSSHVIVISGSNISLVVGILLLAGQRLVGKRYATFLAVIGVILYTILVGADASVTRAAIMGLIYVGAIYLGRGNHVLTALFATGLVMTFISA
jgi:competence protein ComEC